MTLQVAHDDVEAVEALTSADPTVASEEYFAFFGVDAAASANLTDGGGASSHVGTGPTYNADHIVCGPVNTLRMPGGLTAGAYTIMGALKLVPGGSGAAARLFWGSPIALITVSLTPAGLLTLTATGVTSPAATLQIAGSLDRIIFLAFVVGGGGKTMIYNLTDNTASTDGGTGGSVTANAAVYLDFVGGGAGANTWESRFYCGARCAARLTKEEIDAYYLFSKGFMDADRDLVM